VLAGHAGFAVGGGGIRIFQELGRGDRVLALLVDGEPSESFPAALLSLEGPRDAASGHEARSVEPLAADVRDVAGRSKRQSKSLALTRIVAPLLGVAFDELWQRERRRQQRRRTWVAIGVGTLLASMSGYGVYYWDATRLKTAHFDGVVDHAGVEVGLNETKSFQGRQWTYRLLSRVDASSASPSSTGGVSSPRVRWLAAYDVVYQADGRIARTLHFHPNGKLVRKDEYSYQGNTIQIEFKDRYDIPLPLPGTAVAMMRFEYDDRATAGA